MTHCFVTEANGFLGSSMVRELLRKGHEVTALVRADMGRENIEGLPIKVHPAPKVALPYKLLFAVAKIDEFLSYRVTGRESLFPLAVASHARGSRYFASTRAIQELGYAPRPARPVLARAVAWFVTKGFDRHKCVTIIEHHGALAEALADQGRAEHV